MWPRTLLLATTYLLTAAACGSTVVDEDPSIPDDEPYPEPAVSWEIVGFPCLTTLEDDPDFRSFSAGERTLEHGSPGCMGGVCLVDGFQGRATCPEGQAEGEGHCKTLSGEVIEEAVCGQCTGYRTASRMYCSCRCDSLDPDEPTCACPDDFECKPVVTFGPDKGGYCVRKHARDAYSDCGSVPGYWDPACAGLPGSPP